MKILRIQGKNLASIAGEFEIDFTTGPLHSAGIFAICGPTGSGKSTLLDAICLALYNNMPRTTGIEGARMPDVGKEYIQQGDRRQILRRGTTEAIASVDFIAVDGKTYRSVWRVWRANNKANGKLQPAELKVYDLSSHTLITNGISEAENKLIQLTGLTYNQFTRTVLLAQNEFARFLKARKEEKAEVLEKLTGTEIYSVISNIVYTKTAALRAEWKTFTERLGNIRLLTAEEVDALHQQLKELEENEKTVQQKNEIITYKIKWYEQLAHFRQAVEEAKTILQTAVNQQEEAAPLAEWTSLAESIEDCRKLWYSQSEAARSLKNQQQALQICKTSLCRLSLSIRQADQYFGQQQQLFRQYTAQYEALKTQLLEARKMDIDISNISVNLEENRKVYRSTCNSLHEQEDIQSARKEQLIRLKEQSQALKAWFTKHSRHEQMCRNTEIINGLLDTVREADEQLAANSKALQGNEKQLTEITKQFNIQTLRYEQARKEYKQSEQQCQQLRRQLDTIPIAEVRKKRNTLLQQKEQLSKACAHLENLCRILKEIHEYKVLLQNKEDGLLSVNQQSEEILPGLRLLHAQWDTCLHSLEKARLSASHSVRHLRSQLEKDSPCPVCGSLHHPYAENSAPVDAVLQTLQTETEKYEKEYRETENKMIRLTAEQKHLQEDISTLSADLKKRQVLHEELLCLWRDMASHLGVSPDISRNELQQLSDTLSDALEKVREEEHRWEKQNGLLRQTEEQAVKQRSAIDRFHTEIIRINEKTAEIRNNISKANGIIENVKKQQADAHNKISGYINIPDWETRWKNDSSAFRKELNEAAEKWQNKQQQAENTEKEYARLKASYDEQEKNILRLRKNETEAGELIRKKEEDLNHLRQKRAILLEGKTVGEVESYWQQLLRTTGEEMEKASREKEKNNLQAEHLKGQQNQLENAVRQSEEQFMQIENELHQWLTDYQTRTGKMISEQQLAELLNTDPVLLQTEREKLNQLREQLITARATLHEREIRLSQHLHADFRPDNAKESLTALQENLSASKEQLQLFTAQKAEILAEIHTHEENQKQTQEIQQQLHEKASLLEQWSKLDELIGSQSGYKFKEIAQEYTLDILISYANKQLAELTPRYQLKRIPDELALQVIDHDLGDEARSVFSLSGGESFLISLALALGLSSFASRNHYEENLFIDEGFGTLDAETLQIVMEALERLRSQGRQVGIISHVHELAERIPVRICLTKTGNGKSKVEMTSDF